jgi:hypothetical protein
MSVIEIEVVQLRDAVEGARRGSHQLGADTVPGKTCNGFRHLGNSIRS